MCTNLTIQPMIRRRTLFLYYFHCIFSGFGQFSSIFSTKSLINDNKIRRSAVKFIDKEAFHVGGIVLYEPGLLLLLPFIQLLYKIISVKSVTYVYISPVLCSDIPIRFDCLLSETLA